MNWEFVNDYAFDTMGQVRIHPLPPPMDNKPVREPPHHYGEDDGWFAVPSSGDED